MYHVMQTHGMGATGGIQTYLEIVRSEFLMLSFVVASVSATLALVTETFDPVDTVIATLLMLSAQAGVNVINVTSDYRGGSTRTRR